MLFVALYFKRNGEGAQVSSVVQIAVNFGAMRAIAYLKINCSHEKSNLLNVGATWNRSTP
jgi:hypothetical protein